MTDRKDSDTRPPKVNPAEAVGKAVANVGTLVGLPPVSTDPEERHDSGPDETRSPKPDGHPVRKRQSDLGTG